MTMAEVRPVRTEAEYKRALDEIDSLLDAPEGSVASEMLEVLTVLVSDYEQKHYPIANPHPIAFLEFVMESRGLSRKDIEPYIGGRNRVAEILNRKRPLSIQMIRRLNSGLNLPAEVLIQPYELNEK